MFLTSALFGILLTQGAFILFGKSEEICSNVYLSDVNDTALISLLLSQPVDDPYFLNSYCWNITTQVGWQLQGKCNYSQNSPYSMFLAISGDNFQSQEYFYYNYPDEFISPRERLQVLITLYDDTVPVSCKVQSVLSTNVSYVCGPSDVNLTDQYLISAIFPGNLLYLKCTWLVTGGPDTVVFLDILHIDLRLEQRVAFGVGHDPTNDSTSLHSITTINSKFENETSYFLANALIWITAYSPFYQEDLHMFTLRLRSEDFTTEVHCGSQQVRCLRDSKCLPLHAFCDGKVHCSDYSDESNGCDYCGLSELTLKEGEVLSIQGDFEAETEHPDGIQQTGQFVIYKGAFNLIPFANSTREVTITNHTENVHHLNCIWRLTEPNGTRIHVEIAEFDEVNIVLKVGNGHGPSTHAPIFVLDKIMSLPIEIPSLDSGMWVTLERRSSYGYLKKLRLVFRTYRITECEAGQFACPSGLDCLEDISHVCDQRRECSASGDELGCGNCGQREFKCSSSDDCISSYSLCNGINDCLDFSDELMCGYCGNETIHLSSHEAHLLEHGNFDAVCMWLIVGEAGTRIQARVRQSAGCILEFGNSYHSRSEVGSDVIRSVGEYYGAYTFPRSISTNSSVMWITMECRFDIYTDDKLQIDLTQYTAVECSSGEFTCSTGLACVREEAVCDGIADCPEYSDEFRCGNCTVSEFACRSGELCVDSHLICNGIPECIDYSDEFNCGPCSESFLDVSASESLTFTSPGWPMTYPNNVHCFWIIKADAKHRIVLEFKGFVLEEPYDFLYCGDGFEFNKNLLTMTGNRFPLTVASNQDKMFVRFDSDISVRKIGFAIQVQQKLAEEVSCGDGEFACKSELLVCVRNDSSVRGRQFCSKGDCGRSVYYIWSTYRDMISPRYPDPYPSGIDCQWTIQSKSILISVLHFRTESSRDVLRLTGDTFYGGSGVSFQLDGITKVRTIDFNSTQVFVSFTTDSTVTYAGFKLRLFNNFSAFDADETWCPYAGLFDCEDGSCVSLDARCDGFQDCQISGLDELDCGNVNCPEFFHCYNSKDCIYWPLVCDGRPDCNNGDDETDVQCEQRCPVGCDCRVNDGDVNSICKNGWNETTLASLAKRTYRLEISGANIGNLSAGLFKGFAYLKVLLLNNNGIYHIKRGTFSGLQNLTFLDVSDNPISSIEAGSFWELKTLDVMFARNIPLKSLERGAFDGLVRLKTIVLIRGESTSSEPVDVRDGALTDLRSLEKLYVDDYRLCCEFVTSVKDFQASSCQTTELQPPLNLCGSLMRNPFLRVSMWVLGLSAFFGNIVVIVWRCCQGKEKGGKQTHSFLVLNLAISDLMMGVYMIIMAGADLHFGEKYSREAKDWRSSAVCKTAGVLSVLSSEASVFFVTLISVDSFFAIVFPFSRIRLREKSATIIVSVIWAVGVCLSIGPTVLVGSDSKVYGLSDVCIGLPLITKPTSYVVEESNIGSANGGEKIQIPVAKGKQPAWIYSLILFLGVNLACFFVVLCCYISIFVKVKRTVSRVRKTSHRDQEIKLAVKMALIVGTDFICWMPVIVMGILSQTGAVDISPSMYAWVVVFILPINSSLNPYLYTFYTTIAVRRHANSSRSERFNCTTEMKSKSLDTLNSKLSDINS